MSQIPYRHAHYFILALLPAAFIGFWPGFFSNVSGGSAEVHFHAWSATAWIVLLAAQSWAIHHRQVSLHRFLGRTSLLLFPFFFAGFLLVFQSEARSVVAGNPYRTIFGPGIGVLTLVGAITIGYLYFSGLKNRRMPQLHARYLLAVPFLFIESILGRILNGFMPGLIVYSLEDVRKIYWAIHVSQLLMIAFALFLYFRNRQHGTPFLIVIGALILQSIGLEAMDDVGWWRQIFLASTEVPFAASLGAGLIIGILITWQGWVAGRR